MRRELRAAETRSLGCWEEDNVMVCGDPTSHLVKLSYHGRKEQEQEAHSFHTPDQTSSQLSCH